MKKYMSMFIVLFTMVASSAWAQDADHIKLELANLRQERQDAVVKYDAKISALEDKLFDIEGPVPTWLDKPSEAVTGFVAMNYYYDVEKFSVFTINTLAILPNNFSYFGLVNYDNAFQSGELTEFHTFFSEQNLTWSPPETKPFGWNIQWKLRSGTNNDDLKFAPVWYLHQTPVLDKIFTALNATYGINFHLYKIDDNTYDNWEMEHFYSMKVFPGWFDDRVRVAGFMDHTFGSPGDPSVVTENQLEIRVIDNLSLVAEYRRAEFRVGHEDSMGYGVQYKINY